MKLKIIGSNSQGNCYVFTDENKQSIIVDCGVHFREVKVAVGFDYSNISGCIVTHSHGDHRKGLTDLMSNGIDAYMSPDTANEIGIRDHHRVKYILPNQQIQLGPFLIMAVDLKHDVRCYGYVIYHKEMGMTCFLTDTYYIPYRFKGLNNIIVEANYSKQIVDKKLCDNRFLINRIFSSHMEINTTLEFMKAQDLSQVYKILLIHLSDSNSDANMFKNLVQTQVQKECVIAEAGMEIQFNTNPF